MNELQTKPTPARVCGDTQRETRPPASTFTPAPSPAGSFITLCAWCGDVKDGDIFRPMHDYEGEMLACNLSVKVTHGQCPVCAAISHTQMLQLLGGGKQKGTK